MSREFEISGEALGSGSKFSGFRVSTEPNRSSGEPINPSKFLPKSLTKRELRKIAGAEILREPLARPKFIKSTEQEHPEDVLQTPNTKHNVSGVLESTPYEGYSISSRLLFKPPAAGNQATMTRKEFWKQANPSNISQFPPGTNKSMSVLNVEAAFMNTTQRAPGAFAGKDISSNNSVENSAKFSDLVYKTGKFQSPNFISENRETLAAAKKQAQAGPSTTRHGYDIFANQSTFLPSIFGGNPEAVQQGSLKQIRNPRSNSLLAGENYSAISVPQITKDYGASIREYCGFVQELSPLVTNLEYLPRSKIYEGFKSDLEELINLQLDPKKGHLRCKLSGKRFLKILLRLFQNSSISATQTTTLGPLQAQQSQQNPVSDVSTATYNELLLELHNSRALLSELSQETRTQTQLATQIAELQGKIVNLQQQLADQTAVREQLEDKLRKNTALAANMFEGFKIQINTLENSVKALTEENQLVKAHAVFVEQGNRQGWQNENKFRERLGMALEDCAERARTVAELRDHIHDIKRSFGVIESNREQAKDKQRSLQDELKTQSEDIHKYLDRFRNLSKEMFFTYQISCTGEKDVLENNGIELFRDAVSRITRSDHGLEVARSLEFTALDSFLVEKLQFDRSKFDFLNLRKMNPTIFYLVQGDIPKLRNLDIDDMFETRFNILLVLEKVRAILDSYYVEILSTQNLKDCPDFSQFVFNWFEYFEVDPVTKTITKISSDSQEDIVERRMEFLIQLSAPAFLKLWDSYFFIEALNHHFNKDEMIYYLYLRHYILQGLHADALGLGGEYRYLYPTNLLREIVSRIDDPTQASMTKEIFKHIEHSHTSAEYSSTEKTDVYRLLRIFLEVYICKKICKVKSAYESLLSFKKNIATLEKNPSFKTFRTVMQVHFEYLKLSELIELFAQTTNYAGGASINLKSFFVAGQDLCSFILSSHFWPMTKLDYLKQLRKSPVARLDCRLETRLHNKPKELFEVLKESELSNQTDFYSLQEQAYTNFFKVVSRGFNDKVSLEREKLTKMVQQTGSVYLIEKHKQLMKGLNQLDKPDRVYIGSLPVLALQISQLERHVVGLSHSLRGSRLMCAGTEISFLKHMLTQIDPFPAESTEVATNLMSIAALREEKVQRLQRFCTKKLADFYKLIVDLMKFKRSQKTTTTTTANPPGRQTTDTNTQRPTNQTTATTAKHRENTNTNTTAKKSQQLSLGQSPKAARGGGK